MTTLPPRDDATWIQTFTGRQVWPLNPKVEDIDIVDIAHALSSICRFTGHCRNFYSVAEHSVFASWYCPDEPLWALLHDASEAYIADVAKPIKSFIGDYKEIEERLEKVIAEKFGLSWPMPPCVKEIDRVMLATERVDLMPTTRPWNSVEDVSPLPLSLYCWSPAKARAEFMRRFNALTQSS